MEIIIRVDSSIKIGSGHLMRCLTLAHELALRNARILFICRDLTGNLNYLIKNQGFKTVTLPAPEKEFSPTPDDNKHASWLEVSWEKDLEDTQKAITPFQVVFDWVIIDSYAIDSHWENGIRTVSKKILVIDDLADRKHNCDVLIDQNYFENVDRRYQNLVPGKCMTLLGPQYALIRKTIRDAKKFSNLRGRHIARILVYFGGNDPHSLTGMTVEALSNPAFDHLILLIVVGVNYHHLDTLKEQAEQRSKTEIFVQPEGFSELMLRADLCIGAGGSTTWERLCLSLPSIVITTAFNQEAPTKDLNKKGGINWIGTQETMTPQKIRTAVEQMILSNSKHLGQNGSGDISVDGMGTQRVSEILLPSDDTDLSLRSAEIKDMTLYFSWANELTTRKYALTNGQIPWQTHVAWFNKKIQSTETQMWILETSQKIPIGQIRFDVKEGIAEIDYSLDPIVRGRRWGSVLLSLGIKNFKKNNPDTEIIAKVKNDNIPSCAALRKIAFNEICCDPGVTTFHL